MKKIIKLIIDWFFYLMGVFLIGTFLHEFYHYNFCGMDFYAGLNHFENQWQIAGFAYCPVGNNAGTEIIPTTLEILFYLYFIYLKAKK